MKSIIIDAKEVSRGLGITITLKRAKQFSIRLWIAKVLISIAKKVVWFDLEIKENTEGRGDQISTV